jgi:hypothetical protein
MPGIRLRTSIGVFVVVVTWAAALCWARSATVVVAKPGEKVPEERAEHFGWPEGTLEMVNRVTRTFGWTHSFNTRPLGGTYFAFRAHRTEDVQTLLEDIAALKGIVFLEPLKSPRADGVTLKQVSDDGEVAVVISVPNTALVKRWFEGLPEGPDGTRRQGNEVLTAPPVFPTVLRLYVGHPAVQLDRLTLPAGVWVHGGALESADPAVAEEIRAFMEANAGAKLKSKEE